MKRKLRILSFLALIAGLLVVFSANAEEKETEKKPAPVRVAVKPLDAKGVSEDTAATLTDVLCTRLMKHNLFYVLCASDVKEMLARERMISMLGECEDDECHKRMGKLLRTPYIITGSIGKMGETYVITLSFISCECGASAVKRVTHTTKAGGSGLIKAMREAADKLMK